MGMVHCSAFLFRKNSFLPSVRHTTVGIHKQQVTLATEKLTAPPKGEKALGYTESTFHPSSFMPMIRTFK